MGRDVERRAIASYIADSLYAIGKRGYMQERLADILPPVWQRSERTAESAESIIGRISSGLQKLGENE